MKEKGGQKRGTAIQSCVEETDPGSRTKKERESFRKANGFASCIGLEHVLI